MQNHRLPAIGIPHHDAAVFDRDPFQRRRAGNPFGKATHKGDVPGPGRTAVGRVEAQHGVDQHHPLHRDAAGQQRQQGNPHVESSGGQLRRCGRVGRRVADHHVLDRQQWRRKQGEIHRPADADLPMKHGAQTTFHKLLVRRPIDHEGGDKQPGGKDQDGYEQADEQLQQWTFACYLAKPRTARKTGRRTPQPRMG